MKGLCHMICANNNDQISERINIHKVTPADFMCHYVHFGSTMIAGAKEYVNQTCLRLLCCIKLAHAEAEAHYV